MKKNLLTTILLVVVFIASAQEQKLDAKKFYIKGGITVKGKNFYGTNDSKDSKYHDYFWKSYKVKGGNFELGSIFYLDQVKLGEKFRLGIDVNYLTANFNSIIGVESELGYKITTYNFTVGQAVGPLVTYQVNKSIALDAYFKVNPIWVAGDLVASGGQNEQNYLAFEGMKYKMGMNARFDFFVVGLEFNPGSVVFQNYDFATENRGNAGKTNDNNNDKTTKTPLPVFNFNVGFCF